MGCGGGPGADDPIFGPVENIFDAAEQGDIQAARRFIEGGRWDPIDFNHTGRSPLTMAAANGHAEIVRLMVERGAPVNVRDLNGETPLMAAQNNGHEEVVRVLRELGAQE